MNTYYKNHQSFLFVLDYQKSTGICLPESEIPSEYIRFSFNQVSNHDTSPRKVDLQVNEIPYQDYLSKFNAIKWHIENGNTYLCNLTQPTSININLSLEEIFENSRANFKLFLKDHFVVFSPEKFVEIKDHTIHTFPMKGTLSASVEGNREILLNDKKEDAEHNTIVDLLRNDLSIVSNHVRVKKFKQLDQINTNRGPIWQMSSQISGTLKSEFLNTPGYLFDQLLPAGSVTGAPKAKTVAILNEVEKYHRGFYTGVFGYSDGNNIRSAVMIRFIEQTPGGFIYKSGGGITSLSKPELEYEELLQKIYVPVF